MSWKVSNAIAAEVGHFVLSGIQKRDGSRKNGLDALLSVVLV